MSCILRRILTLLLLVIMSSIAKDLHAQRTESMQIVKGRVKNEAKNYFLTSATATLFKADSTLVSFQITDSYGSFSFKDLLVGQDYFIQISNMGYEHYSRSFRVDKPGFTLDLGIIHLEERAIKIDEVAINVSPVRMNGDTLEFNPRGLKIDSNALAEDFLRKIPNITIWNDGQITVNGREIKTLLVNGKPFFSGDFKIATQNLPTHIIDKVQVYKREENKLNPLDSIMEMNIKLKKGSESGYFGKLTLGGGISNRFDLEGTFNYYTKQTQISAALAGNNTNKIAEDIGTLMAQATYKTSTNYLDYQTDAGLHGINNVYLGGVSLHHDFIKDPKFNNRNHITADHFYQDRQTSATVDNSTLTNLADGAKNVETGNNTSDMSTRSNSINLNYRLIKPDQSLAFETSLTRQDEGASDLSSRSVTDGSDQQLSNSHAVYNSMASSERYLFNFNYNYNPREYVKKKLLPLSFSYSGVLHDSESNSNLQRTFTSFTDPGSSTVFDRKYHAILAKNQHNVKFSLKDLNQILWGYARHLLNIDLLGNFVRSTAEQRSVVSDFDTDAYTINNFLSDQNSELEQTWVYGARLGKTFARRLSERYEKSTSFSFGLLFTDISFKNNSLLNFRNIQRRYADFFPEISFIRSNNVFGRSLTTISSEIKTELNIPHIDQLAPLVDSAEIYFIRLGNLDLDREKIYNANASFEYVDQRPKNPLVYKFGAGISYSDNKIIDSILITPDNRQQAFAVNGNSFLMFRASLEVRKAIKFATSDLKAFFGANFDQASSPTYINEVFLKNNSKNLNLTATLGYGLTDLLNIELREKLLLRELKQEVLNSQFNGTTLAHTLSVNYAIRENFSINSNLTYNSNTSTGASPVKFTIWNAYLTYRMLRDKNAELKLSAIDLLGQNRNVSNTFNNGNFATVYRNNLQRYVMLSFSYYPRKFMKK